MTTNIRGLNVRDFLAWLGENPDREGLLETPSRFQLAWEFWTSGYDKDPKEVLKSFEDGAEGYDTLVFQGAIPVWSMCEHHLSPFFGVAHVGYIPNKRIVGLSKMVRIVDVFARRLQVQERLTRQIADAMKEGLDPKAVGVTLRCRHTCMESRGVQKAGTMTYTSALLGDFMTDPQSRAEYMQFVDRADAQATI